MLGVGVVVLALGDGVVEVVDGLGEGVVVEVLGDGVGVVVEGVGEGVGVEMQEAKAIDRLTDGDLRATRQDLCLPIQYDEEGIVARRDRELDRLVLGDDQGAHRQ